LRARPAVLARITDGVATATSAVRWTQEAGLAGIAAEVAAGWNAVRETVARVLSSNLVAASVAAKRLSKTIRKTVARVLSGIEVAASVPAGQTAVVETIARGLAAEEIAAAVPANRLSKAIREAVARVLPGIVASVAAGRNAVEGAAARIFAG